MTYCKTVLLVIKLFKKAEGRDFMKKKLILLTALVLSVTMLASCGKKEPAESAIKDADEAVEYLEENKEKLTSDETVRESIDMNNMIESVAVLAEEYLGDEAVAKIKNDALDKVMDRVSYEVESARINPDNPKQVIVDAKVTVPSAQNTKIDDIDYMAIAAKVFGNMSQQEIAQLVMSRTGMSKEELKAAYESGSQSAINRIIAAFEPEIKQFSGGAVDELLDSAGTEEKDAQFTLEKQGGDWKIVDSSGF